VLEKAAVLDSSDIVVMELCRVLIPGLCCVLVIAPGNGLTSMQKPLHSLVSTLSLPFSKLPLHVSLMSLAVYGSPLFSYSVLLGVSLGMSAKVFLALRLLLA